MEVHFKIIGYLLAILSSLHAIFPKYFNWKEELKTLSLVNQELMKVHTFFIALAVFLIGLLCITSTEDLINTNLGKTVSLGIGIFWLFRLLFQFVGYSPEIWKGKVFETTIHILASIFWTYLSVVFISTYFG